MTQEHLAERAGVSRATINGLETGAVRELGFHKVEAVLDALGLRLAAVSSAGRASAARPRPRAAPGFAGDPAVRALLRKLARRYIWWSRGDESLRDPWRVVAQVMDMGTLEDVQRLASAVGEGTMAEVLGRARPGWFRPKSWAFWHAAPGLSEDGTTPPIPVRRTDALPDPH